MRARHPLLVAIIASTSCLGLQSRAAAGDLETAGTLVLIALPATSGALNVAHRDGQGAKQLATSLVVTAGLTMALKYAISETRPIGGEHSFPSGHAALAFSAAECMYARYGWQCGAPAIAAASFVAYSRVASRQHYVHDVVAGAVIGVASSALLTKPYKGRKAAMLGERGAVVVGVWRCW
ncbi:MAG: phosphatase PAP2 family protein [bacterium]|jgi:membrane-associated phospholipid phosphatase|nr:phosphatase PAP2 family protein [candidate division KSB1 bacterium]MDH7560817.1 phosphatase PAP2 family protein [bacterium]